MLFVLFPLQLAVCQDNAKNKELFLEAESYFLYEEYTEALPIYTKLKAAYPDNFNLDYKIGRCLITIPYEKHRSVSFLENASKHISNISKDANFKELNAPVDALFYLGDAYRVNNQIEKAIKSYESFVQQSNSKDFDHTLAEDQIKSCKRAIEAEKNPVEVSMTNIGEIVNTRFSETNPVISENETMMVYASKLPFYEAMYYSKKENGKWTAPVNMIPDLGVDGDCFPTSISGDGTELYVYRNNEFKGDIFVTNFQNGKWTKLRKLNDNINTKYWESHAFISHDGKTLYFTSNRKGGFGGLDIYKSTRTSGDNWGPAVNLGSTINSSYNDDCPFLLSSGKRIYFSSFGHETMGGYDVFYSDLKSDGSWGMPVNLGFPVNTTDDDLFYMPLYDGSIGYSARYSRDGFGKFDIYRFEIFSEVHPRKYMVTGSVNMPAELSSHGKLRIAVYDVNKKDTIFRQSGIQDKFSFETTKGNYQVILSGQGMQTQVVPLIISKGSSKNDYAINAVMKPQKAITELPTASNQVAKNTSSVLNSGVAEELAKETNGKETMSPEDTLVSENKQSDSTISVMEDTLKKTSINPVSEKKVELTSDSRLYLFGSGILGVLLLVFLFIFKRRKKDQE